MAVGGSVGRSRRKEGGSIPSSSTFFSRSTSHQNQHDHDEPRTVGTSRGITRRDDVEEPEEDSGADNGEVEHLSKNKFLTRSQSRVREVQVQRKRVREVQGEGRLGCRRDDDRVDSAKESEEEGGAQCHQDEGESDGGSRKE